MSERRIAAAALMIAAMAAAFAAEASKRPEISWSIMHPTAVDVGYMRRVAAKAVEYGGVDSFEVCGACHSLYGGINGLSMLDPYPHAHALVDPEKVKKARAELNAICDIAHGIGKPLYYWHREVYIPKGLMEDLPSLMDEDGEFDLLGDAYKDYLRFKLAETFKHCPGLDGIALTLTEADFSVIHNSNPTRYPPQKVVDHLVSIFAEEHERRGKRFILRSFGSNAQDYRDIIGGAVAAARRHGFEIETKVTEADFVPWLPKNPFLKKNPPLTLGAECDALGEYLGAGYLPAAQVGRIREYVASAREEDVDRYTIRIDRVGNSIFDSAHEVNLYAYMRFIRDPKATADEVIAEYAKKRFGAAADAMVPVVKGELEMVRDIHYIASNLTFHSFPLRPNMKWLKSGGIYSVYREGADLADTKDIWSILHWMRTPSHAQILAEKAEGLRLAEKGLATIEQMKGKLPDDEYDRQHRAFETAVKAAKALQAYTKCVVAYFDDMASGRDEPTTLRRECDAAVRLIESMMTNVGDDYKSDMKTYFATAGRNLDRVYFIGLRFYCRELLREYALERSMRRALEKRADVIDFVVPGGIYDDNRTIRTMHGAHSTAKADRVVRTAGNAVFPNGTITVKFRDVPGAKVEVALDPDGAQVYSMTETVADGVRTVVIGKKGAKYPEILYIALVRSGGASASLDLNDGWRGEMRSEKGLAVRRESIRLPHNWDDYFGMRGFRHGNLHGTATYRRTFDAPSLAGRRSFFVFDGAGTYLTVRLNGRTLCERRPAGRLVTTVEATDAAKEGANELEVVCDHPSEIQDMPWHCGGCSGIGSEGPEPFGLFRRVRFETTDDVRIAPFGVHVWHDGDCRTAFVETELTAGAAGGERTLTVRCPELGVDGSARVSVPPHGAVTNRMSFAIPGVERWSTENPRLYYFDVSAGDERVRVRTGFATYRWPIPPCVKDEDGNDEHRFLLNGSPVFLHGTCETDNRFGSNVAFDDEEIDARAAELRRLGMNAWRDGHEPHDLRFGRHWDEYGVVWWPQLSTHTFFDTPEFKRNFLAAIEQWVKERRNSPSVALWGLQNESVIIEDFARECTELIHRLDPLSGPGGRAVTTCNYGTGTDWNVIQNWSGCYSGEIRDYQYELGRPDQLLNGEYGAWRSLGFHSDPDAPYVKSMPWTEEHAAHVLWQKMLRAWDVRDHVCGQFLWTFFTHESPGRLATNVEDSYRVVDKVGPLNPKGIYTLWGARVAAWYMYRSYGELLRNGKLDEARYRPLSWFIAEGRRLSAPPPAPAFAPSAAPGEKYLHRVNCGGDALVDSLGNSWSADSTACSRSWSADDDLQDPKLRMDPVLCSQGVVDGGVVNAAAADAALFSTYRFGRERLTFTFAAPPGLPCTVEMYFAEPGSYGRIFDIAVNGSVVASKFNLGVLPERTVVKREFRATASAEGRIVVGFPRVWCNQAVVSAIAVRTADASAAVPPEKAGYPASAGLTWAELCSQVREKTTAEHLPVSEQVKLAPLTPLQTKRYKPEHNADMNAAAYLYRVASDYSVAMLVKGGDRRGKKVRWLLERPDGEGWKVEASGEADVPQSGDRFEIKMGTTLNAGYYVFYYRCDGLELSAREMK